MADDRWWDGLEQCRLGSTDIRAGHAHYVDIESVFAVLEGCKHLADRCCVAT